MIPLRGYHYTTYASDVQIISIVITAGVYCLLSVFVNLYRLINGKVYVFASSLE